MTRDTLIRVLVGLFCLAVMVGLPLFLRSLALDERGNHEEMAERLGKLYRGRQAEEIRVASGAPDVVCSAIPESMRHLRRHAAVYKPPEVFDRVVAATKERWIYFCTGPTFRRENRARCRPGNGDAELGFDANGRLLWAVLGDSLRIF